MGWKIALALLAGAAAAAYAASASRRRVAVGDPVGNGGSSGRHEAIRRVVGEARERLEADSRPG